MMRSTFIALAVAAGSLVWSGAAAADGQSESTGPPDTFVTAWDAVGTQAFSAAALSPAEGHTIFAYVAVAVYDSVMAVEGGYEPFAVDVDAPGGASAEAAVAAAAHRVLVHYLPAQAATILDPAYTASLATIPDGQRREAMASRTGERVARRWLDQRADDGFRAPVDRTRRRTRRSQACGCRPPPPRRSAPISAMMKPFSLDSADQFRPAGPPRACTAGVGPGTTTRSRRSARRRARPAPPSRPSPPGSGPRPRCSRPAASFRRFIADHDLDIVDAARFMAMVSVTYADAFIACFDAKYEYAFWRPITAIRAGDTDGNPATVGDPDWATLLPATPNHPEYPSAHSCITPAGGGSSPSSSARNASTSPSPA